MYRRAAACIDKILLDGTGEQAETGIEEGGIDAVGIHVDDAGVRVEPAPAPLGILEGAGLDDPLPDADGTQAADAPRIAQQLAFDAEALLAVVVDDKPRPALAELGIERLEDVAVRVDRRTPTLRDIATRKVSIDSKPYIGTPERVADELARTIDAVGGDGFAIRQGIWPGYVGPFVEKVIPLLQQRGAVRTEYTGTTLREHLREF
jgi:hypothetical protein